MTMYFKAPHATVPTPVNGKKDKGLQSTSLITTLGGASKKCPYSRSVVIPEVSLLYYRWKGLYYRLGRDKREIKEESRWKRKDYNYASHTHTRACILIVRE